MSAPVAPAPAAKLSRWWLVPMVVLLLFFTVSTVLNIREDRRAERRVAIDSAYTVGKQRNDSVLSALNARLDSIEIAKAQARGKD
jgi:hypothetical protein